MSGVLSTKRTTQDPYLPNGATRYWQLPSCQTATSVAFDSAVLQAVTKFDSAHSLSWVWSMYVKGPRGFMAFQALQASLLCPPPTYTPLVPQLASAPSTLGKTPWRYYVAQVQAWEVLQGSSGWVSAPAPPPAYMVIDTGTTEVMLPGDNGASNATALTAETRSRLVFAGGATISFHPGVNTTFTGADGSISPSIVAMPASISAAFSSDGTVGILGAAGMGGHYLEFNLGSTRTLGISYLG
jgi:hypothetical protein